MLKLRYYLRFIVTFVSRFKGVILISMVLATLSFFFSRIIGTSNVFGSVERIGVVGRYRSTNLPQFILEEIGDGLTSVDSIGQVKPNLAKTWSTPDKGKTWIFKLAQNKTWSDGKKVQSQDLSYEFSDVKIEKPDKETIIFILQNPFSPFPSVVSKPILKKGLIGTGKYKIDNISISSGFVNEVTLIDSKAKKKTYKFYPTEDAGKLAFKLGKVDTLENLFDPKPLDTWKNINLKKRVDTDRVVTLFLNTKDKYLSDKSLRQALSYAIDKSAFASSRAISPISPSSWAYNPQVKPYNFDQNRAKDLVKDLPASLKDNMEINIISSPILVPQADAISKNWKNIGISSKVQVSSGIPNEFQSFLVILDIPKDPDQYSLWHSTQDESNISNFQSPRIDKLLEDGRIELDQEQRKKIYYDFQRFLLEDSPSIFLYHPYSYTISRK